MDELKTIFGDNALTYDQFQQAVDGAQIKLADLGKGEYVSADKYKRLQADYAKYKEDNPIGKYADYDEIKAKVAEYKRKEEEAVLFDKIQKVGVDPRFAKFVLAEVNAQVTEQNDFDKCLQAYVEANPQFAAVQEAQKTFHFGSSVPLAGDKATEKSTNEKMNEIIRSARAK